MIKFFIVVKLGVIDLTLLLKQVSPHLFSFEFNEEILNGLCAEHARVAFFPYPISNT